MSEPLFPLDRSSLPQVTAEAAAIRELLARQVPAYHRSVRAVSLSEDESPLIRAFWHAVGWSVVFERCALEEPEIPTGLERVRQRLAEYRQGDPDFTITENDLPARFRLVYADSDGIGFIITDESGGVADPPLLGVSWDENAIQPEYPSYLNWCANEVLRCAFEPWYNTMIRLSDMAPLHAAEAPFPTLSPATRRLNDALWLTASAPAVAAPGEPCNLAASEFNALVEWLYEHDTGGIEIALLPGKIISRSEPLVPASSPRGRLRTIPGLDASLRYHVGWIADIGVIAREKTGRTEVAVNPRHHDELQAALRSA
ncbi:hypothetical protein WMF31_41770 [Sorangium sp. So ce1036]|uniref:hypothetical protein n=1 Tax=Sorangium sp. So ce1036 TaxID=3133328 RepID=UPI003F0F00BE